MIQNAAAVPGLLLFTAPGRARSVPPVANLAVEEVSSPSEMHSGDAPAAVLVVDESDWDTAQLKALPPEMVILAASEGARVRADAAHRVFLPVELDGDPASMACLFRSAARQSTALRTSYRAQAEMREANKIGLALMSERDPDRLLGQILTQARRLTTSDAGSLYLVEEGEDETEHLHFLLAQNDSLPNLPSPDYFLPLDASSIAGYVGSTGKILILEDAYEIPEDRPYSFNRGFDESVGYRGKSMLVVPMMDHRDRVVGVLQLINRKRDPSGVIRDDPSSDEHVIPYSQRDVELVRGLAGQAAVSIENGHLYRNIENLFEGFIKAAVTAIDQRDPTTSGHSVRVTALTCDLAQEAHNATEGPYRDVFFSQREMKQLRYAGLLHDFGKVGVREEVLVKMNKLSPVLETRILARFDYIHQWLEAENQREKTLFLAEHGKNNFEVQRQILDRKLAQELSRLEQYRAAILEANAPRVLEEEASRVLDEIAATTYVAPDGSDRPYLAPEELYFLKIPRGSLDPDERKQVESHVVHSYNYLVQIPWTEELTRIPEIVQGHHEKLNGKGYPRGVTGQDIPLETRFMTVSDIFDALTASDRPYKKAIPVEKALSILRMEAERGELDSDAVDLFIESRVYERVLNTDWREL
jgi:HD-GYP domain-containing protein (c-di-GMP phosphodiesterase class II)